MNKGKILEGLNSVQNDLKEVNQKLENLLNEKIWDAQVSDELDKAILIAQELQQKINDIIDIQQQIIIK